MPAGSQGSPIVKAASSVATFLRDSSVFDLSRMLWNVFFCQLFIGALNLISLNLNSENMTDHLSSSPALAGAASKRVKAFFHFSHRKKKNQKEAEYFIYVFLFFFLKDRKGKEGKMFFSRKDRYQQVCPVWLLGAGWFFKTVFFFFFFWQQSCPETFNDLWVRIWQPSFQRCSSEWRVGGRGEEREEGIWENDFSPSLPASGRIVFHRQQELSSHTVLLFAEVRAGDLRSHLTQAEQRNMVHFHSSPERAESFEGHYSIHLQQVRGALLRFQSSLCLVLGHKSTQSLYSSIKRLLSPTLFKTLSWPC